MEKVVNNSSIQAFYKGKRVFLTGHTGFKGSWLLMCLQQMGAIVKGYALAPTNENDLFYSLPQNSFQSQIADINDKETLLNAITEFQPDIVFHLAAQALVIEGYKDPANTFVTNAIGTLNVLESIKKIKNKCAIVIVTTDKVYDNKETDVLYVETDALGGYDPYSASKACAEIITSSMRNSFFNVNEFDQHLKLIATARAGNVIGGGDFSANRIIPDIVESLKNDCTIEIRNPNAVRPWQHVLEPLFGYMELALCLWENPQKFSEAFNFGPEPEDHLSVKDLVQESIRVWGKGDWKDISTNKQVHEATLLKLDISKAKLFMNWKPRLNAKLAIEWTIEWYKNSHDNRFEYSVKQINEYMKL